MQHFYRIGEGVQVNGAMNAIMLKQDRFQGQGVKEMVLRRYDNPATLPHDTENAKAFPLLKNVALAVMQSVGGSVLGGVAVLRMAPKFDQPLARSGVSTYLVVLHSGGRSVANAGDEATQLATGEVWWIDLKSGEPRLMNNSDDDLFVMVVEVNIDQ